MCRITAVLLERRSPPPTGLKAGLDASSLQVGWKVREPSGKAVEGWLDGSPAPVAEACGHAAVADDDRARDVRGIVGGQKGVDGGDLFRPGGTVERDVRPVLRPRAWVGDDAVGCPVGDPAWRDAIDPDA